MPKGFKHSEETKRKIALFRHPKEVYQRIGEASRLRKRSPEQRMLMSRIAKEKGFGKWQLGRHLS